MADITHLNFFCNIFVDFRKKALAPLLKIWYKFFINTYYEQIKIQKK